LPEDVLKSIASFEINQDDEATHQLVWKGATNGGFFIKIALKLIRADIEEVQDSIWQVTWRLQVPRRFKFFIWLVAHDRVMTNSNRLH